MFRFGVLAERAAVRGLASDASRVGFGDGEVDGFELGGQLSEPTVAVEPGLVFLIVGVELVLGVQVGILYCRSGCPGPRCCISPGRVARAQRLC